MVKDHIKFGNDQGYLTLIIDDWELFDFVDDYLVNIDLNFEFYSEIKNKSGISYQMYFKPEIGTEKLKTAIAALDEKEIQRIWELNN